jgi:P27 family predicted phage terminase small subunit
MPPIGREYWTHVVAELSTVPQLLRRVDRGVLEQLCKAYDRWCTFEWFCDSNGWTYDYEQHYIDMNGTPAVKKYPRARPEARLAKDAGQEFDRLRSELGLSPAARVRLAVPQTARRQNLIDAD